MALAVRTWQLVEQGPFPGMPFSALLVAASGILLQGCLQSPDLGPLGAERVFSRDARQNFPLWQLGCRKQVGKQ